MNMPCRLLLWSLLSSIGTQAVVAQQNAASNKVVESQTTITLGIQTTQFTLNGTPAFLYGISYYGALGAPDGIIRDDLADLKRCGFNWIRVWANWRAFGADAAAVDGDGRVIAAGMDKLKRLVAECDRRRMVVDVTLSRGNGISGPPRLQSLEAHRRAMESIVTALKPFRNWYLDLSNERNIRDKRFTSFDDLKALREAVRKIDSERLVTASHAGDITRDELQQYLQTARVDFIAPHRPREADSPGQTETKTPGYFAWMKDMNRLVPVHYQEPFRRGFGKWEPVATDFITDARSARKSGAAGWCFHNGDQRSRTDGVPRRSFDLREKRLFDQLDEEELRAIKDLKDIFVELHR
jgi:hypothetical protein